MFTKKTITKVRKTKRIVQSLNKTKVIQRKVQKMEASREISNPGTARYEYKVPTPPLCYDAVVEQAGLVDYKQLIRDAVIPSFVHD